MSKRGISAIVATVLIILITVAAITIVWSFVIPMISENLVFAELEGRVDILTASGYTFYDAAREVASVQVKRDSEEGSMSRVNVVFSFGGESISSSVVAPEPGSTRVYNFDLSEYGVPTEVSVVPIFLVGEMEKVGDATSSAVVVNGSADNFLTGVYDLGGEYFSEFSSDGLMSMWTFSGDARDDFGDNDGILIGDASIVDGELLVDGNNDGANMSDIDWLDRPGYFSISLWFNRTIDNDITTNHGLENILFAKSSGPSNDNIEIGTDGSNIEIYLDSAGNDLVQTYPSNITDGVWYNLVLTYDRDRSNEAALYLDGEEIVQTSIWGGVLDNSSRSLVSVGISRVEGENWGEFEGRIDNVMIWDRALSEEEVSDVYDSLKK
jgi:hypothetical protein